MQSTILHNRVGSRGWIARASGEFAFPVIPDRFAVYKSPFPAIRVARVQRAHVYNEHAAAAAATAVYMYVSAVFVEEFDPFTFVLFRLSVLFPLLPLSLCPSVFLSQSFCISDLFSLSSYLEANILLTEICAGYGLERCDTGVPIDTWSARVDI